MDKKNTDYIYNEIKKRIIDMEYKPGELLNEKKLLEEFNVSRTPIRESLLKLSQKGLITIVPRVGTYVSQVDIRIAKNAYEVKKSLEGLAAELAAQRASDLEKKKLLDIIKRIESYDNVKNYKEYIKEDQIFHQITREASRNPLLIELLEDLNMHTARFLQYVGYVVEDVNWYQDSLKEIANAIIDGNSQKANEEAKNHTVVFLEKLSKMMFLK